MDWSLCVGWEVVFRLICGRSLWGGCCGVVAVGWSLWVGRDGKIAMLVGCLVLGVVV